MYRMSNKSKAVRFTLLPFWSLICLAGFVFWALAHVFDYLWSGFDMCREKFEAWVDRIAPLSIQEGNDDDDDV